MKNNALRLFLLGCFAAAALIAGCGSSGGKADGSDADYEGLDKEEAEAECAKDDECPMGKKCFAGKCYGLEEKIKMGAQTGSTLELDARGGVFSLYSADGKIIIKNGFASFFINDYDLEITTKDERPSAVETTNGTDDLGAFNAVELKYAAKRGVPAFSWKIVAYGDKSFAFSLKTTNEEDVRIAINKSVPLKTAGARNGGFFFGAEPKEHRILDNGSALFADHYAGIEPGDKGPDALITLVPGRMEGYSVSNWNHLVYDVKTKKAFVAGALTFYSGVPVMNLRYEPAEGEYKSEDGRTGFDFYSLENVFLPNGKPLDKGESAVGEIMYVNADAKSAHEALESYAAAVKKTMKIKTWIDKGKRVPNGWNSWTGSSGTGGYGQDISRELMEKNLEVMKKNFRDFGVDYFQIDDGWQKGNGDWEVKTDKFPDGFSKEAGLLKEIYDAGLLPGAWMSAFSTSPDAQIYKDHPDWFMPFTYVGKLMFSQYKMLDPSNPYVIAYFQELFSRFRNDWGMRWLKMDFSYPAIACEGYKDDKLTSVELYRKGLKLIRDALGDDVHFNYVALMGPTYGIVDSNRVTLDNAPVWDYENGQNSVSARQGFKPTICTGARRYYLHNNVFLLHPDLIFFRSNVKDDKDPPVTFNETRAFCAYVAATGGIVKIGDRMVEDIAPYEERVTLVRQLLPIHDKAARPLDLMEREFPEVYFKKIENGFDGLQETFGWAAFLNLGVNSDLTTNPATPIEDGKERAYSLDIAALMGEDANTTFHVFEFWSQKYLGEKSGSMVVSAPAHDSKVVAIRKKRDRPQFIAWNRQITMGGVEIKSVTWDELTNSLTAVIKTQKSDYDYAVDGAHPFKYKLWFAGNGYELESSKPLDSSIAKNFETGAESGLVYVQFTPTDKAELAIELKFKK